MAHRRHPHLGAALPGVLRRRDAWRLGHVAAGGQVDGGADVQGALLADAAAPPLHGPLVEVLAQLLQADTHLAVRLQQQRRFRVQQRRPPMHYEHAESIALSILVHVRTKPASNGDQHCCEESQGQEGNLTWKLLTTPRFRTTRPFIAPKTADTTCSAVGAQTVNIHTPFWQPDHSAARSSLVLVCADAHPPGHAGEGHAAAGGLAEGTTKASAARRVEDARVDQGEHEGGQHAGDDQDDIRVRAWHPRRLPVRQQELCGGVLLRGLHYQEDLDLTTFRRSLLFRSLRSKPRPFYTTPRLSHFQALQLEHAELPACATTNQMSQ